MSVSFFTPKRQLSALLRAPGGLPVEEAIAKATANLGELAGACVAEVGQSIDKAEACMAKSPPTYDEGFLMELYGLVSPPIGVASVCGLGAIDVALHSLCDLIDHLHTTGRWDVEALQVHVQALKLLLHTESAQNAEQTEAVLSGLRQVSQRYAAPTKPDATPAA
ncbi:hypothetical protein [Phenylobacterium sp.]|uniref:hypothetical protein n=1 Tax=Phenylobacterium sp. TaxID=1871053 RepID=UPI0035ADB82C